MFKRLFRQKSPWEEPRSYVDDQPDRISKALQHLHELTQQNCLECAGSCWRDFLEAVVNSILAEVKRTPSDIRTNDQFYEDVLRRALRRNDFDPDDFFLEDDHAAE